MRHRLPLASCPRPSRASDSAVRAVRAIGNWIAESAPQWRSSAAADGELSDRRIPLTLGVAPTYGPAMSTIQMTRARSLSFLLLACLLHTTQANADYRSIVLADGAAPYYRLADAETPIAFDASPWHEDAVADSDGVSFDQPGIITSNSDGAIYVNGSGGLQRAPSANPAAYSIDGWFQLDGITLNQALVARVRADNTWAQMVSIGEDGHLRHLVWDGGEQIIVGTSVITSGQPFHVAITASNDGMMRLYLNGVEDDAARHRDDGRR